MTTSRLGHAGEVDGSVGSLARGGRQRSLPDLALLSADVVKVPHGGRDPEEAVRGLGAVHAHLGHPAVLPVVVHLDLLVVGPVVRGPDGGDATGVDTLQGIKAFFKLQVRVGRSVD